MTFEQAVTLRSIGYFCQKLSIRNVEQRIAAKCQCWLRQSEQGVCGMRFKNALP